MATMRVPKAVTAAAARADELLKTLDDIEPTEEVVETAPQVQAPPVTTPPPAPIEVKDESYWQHRFKTTEGILNSTNRRHAEELKARETRLAEMQAQINELANKAAVIPKQYDIRQYISPENITQFGEDLPKVILEMASKVSKEAAQEEVSRVLKQELEPVRNQVKLTQESAQQELVNNFWKSLQRAVPDYQVVNGDPKFLNWLSEREGFTKFTRDDVLKEAERNMDSDTVIELFQAFKKSAVPAPPVDVRRKVLPESSAPTNPAPVDEAPLFTGEQVQRAYNDFARGLYRGKLDEWNKLEQRMNEAIRSNRVS